MKIVAGAPREQEWAWAVEDARQIAEYAGDKGETVLLSRGTAAGSGFTIGPCPLVRQQPCHPRAGSSGLQADETLRDIKFTGYASFELLPAAGDVFGVLKGGKAPEF